MIVVLDIREEPDHQILLIASPDSADAVCTVRQVKKQKPHRCLGEKAFLRRVSQHGTDQVFGEILDRKNSGNVEIEVVSACVFVSQAGDEEGAQRAFRVSEHPESRVKKLGQDHEINGEIIPPAGEYLLRRMLVEKEKVTGVQRDLPAVDDMRGAALAHVNKFDEIVRVPREMHKAHMAPDVDHFSVLENQRRINFILPCGHCRRIVVKSTINLPVSRKDFFFFLCDFGKIQKQLFIENIPFVA